MLLHGDLPLAWAGPAAAPAGLVIAGVLYARGWRGYRRRLPERFAARQLTAFLAGLACLCIAIASPLDEAADTKLSAHMMQHILLLTVAPALLLLGDPLLPLLCGLPDSLRRSLVAPLLRWRSLRDAAHALAHPLAALFLSSVIFWSWHVPALYQLALRVPAIHVVEHASFVAGGLLFWYPVVQPWPSRPRWPSRAMEAAALDDQVLAGVIMWVPMSLAFLVPAALLTIRLLSPAKPPSGRTVGLVLSR